jgi:hypothetical protein
MSLPAHRPLYREILHDAWMLTWQKQAKRGTNAAKILLEGNISFDGTAIGSLMPP